MPSKYAYVTTLYGSNEYFLGTLMLGYSLSKINSNYDKVVLVTSDVNNNIRDILKNYFIVIDIEYIKVNTINFVEKGGRFEEVFTKLQALALDQYDKIILLDSDMYILKNMDHLFELPAPAGLFRSLDMKEKPKLGGKINSQYIKIKNNKVHGIVNAGLLLLEPSKDELKDILDAVNSPLNYKLLNPEQEYLSFRYKDKWHYIGKEYNYQFSDTVNTKNKLSIHDIYNLHYSWVLKPWDLLFEHKKKILRILKKQRRVLTFYYLWVYEYNIVNKIYKQKNIDIKASFTYKNSLKNYIDKLYDESNN
jgi:alpha-N-acetylglucosamine transferase